ncbi:MAG: AsmA-like C-terminal domain-containing protein, partial [Alphaproteobacteria bacterium]
DLANIVISEANGKLAAVQGQVQYLEGMPRVQNVNADATFDLQKMSVLVSSGHIGDLRLVPFTLLMTDLDTNLQMIEIPLKVEGPITDVLKLIDEPPLGYANAVGLSPSDVTGRARATLNLKFPLLKTLLVKDIEIKGQADLIDLASSKLLKGIDITQGNLSLDLNKESFAIKGPASLNKVPFKILWEQNFSTDQGKPLRHAEVEGMIAGDQWNLLGIEALNGTRGSVAAFIELTQPNKEKTFLTGKFDMTSAEVHVDQLSWKKPSAVPATFKFAAEMEEGRDTKITSLDLIGGDAKIKGDALLSADNQLRALNLNPLMIGRTNAVIKFWQEKDEPHTAHYEIEGQSVDVSGIKSGGDAVAGNSSGKVAPAAQPPKRYKIKLAKLFTSETGYIADLQGHAARDDKGWNEIQLQGMAQGAHKLNVDLAQRSGSRFLAITCDNFGKALHGLGFTDAVNDGKLDIRGQSSPDNPYAIQGRMKIGRFDVTNLPILALLLNATSPFGIVGLLTDTISFESARGRFKWDGDVLEFIDARVSGQSLGLNIEGKVNTETNTANLSGTVVPFSMVNRFLSAIPLIGDMLTGGDGGGVLAVAYTIKGDLSQPDVSVNPVSLLTPGFLRNLFFGGIDEEEEPTQELPKEENPPPPVITNFNKKP